MWHGERIAVDAEFCSTIWAIKEQICVKTGLSPHLQHLIYDGSLLKDNDRTLADCNIKDEAVLHLAVNFCRGFPIYVRICSGVAFGSMITLDVAATDKVVDVKRAIEASQGVALQSQHLSCEGKCLDDMQSNLSDYNLRHGSELELRVRSDVCCSLM